MSLFLQEISNVDSDSFLYCFENGNRLTTNLSLSLIKIIQSKLFNVADSDQEAAVSALCKLLSSDNPSFLTYLKAASLLSDGKNQLQFISKTKLPVTLMKLYLFLIQISPDDFVKMMLLTRDVSSSMIESSENSSRLSISILNAVIETCGQCLLNFSRYSDIVYELRESGVFQQFFSIFTSTKFPLEGYIYRKKYDFIQSFLFISFSNSSFIIIILSFLL